eukprot:5295622-Amphidinium_carterae.4
MGQAGVEVAKSQAHADRVIQACAGPREKAAFFYSTPMPRVDCIVPVAFFASTFLHLGAHPATTLVVHKTCTTHVKRSASLSIGVMIFDLADECCPHSRTSKVSDPCLHKLRAQMGISRSLHWSACSISLNPLHLAAYS